MGFFNALEVITLISVAPVIFSLLKYIWKRFIHALYEGLKDEYRKDTSN